MLKFQYKREWDLQVVLPPQLQEEVPSPRILGTHMHPDNIPASFYEKKVKVSFSLSFKSDFLLFCSCWLKRL